jgi:methionyl-tRNA synthetase
MAETFYLTTAIDYTNGAPHIGHAYEKVLADVMARYHRLAGRPVYYLTGVDQHGQKVQQSAEKEGVQPQQFADRITGLFLALWEKLGVEFDGWAATTDPLHKACVQRTLQRLHDEGQLYKQAYKGFYSVRQEQFLTDKEREENGEFGEEWGQVVEIEEETWYFRIAQHREWLLALIDQREDLVVPAFRRGELRNAVEKLTSDLSISRPKARLAWGIELPFDTDYVTYVWFDALMNYLSFAGFDKQQADLPDFEKLWPALHVIGKDILIPAHGIYWMIMLHALGFRDDQMPQLLVHGWWNISGAKMSKTIGNVVDPSELTDKYGFQAVRYYLMSDIATGKDADFSEERLVLRYNTDLANSLGNLLNRTLNMAQKYRAGRLAKFNHPGDLNVEAVANGCVDAYRDRMDGMLTTHDGIRQKTEPYQLHSALASAFDLVNHCNQFIDQEKPWALAKDPEQAQRLDAVLYHLSDSIRIVAILLSPVLPAACRGIFEQLNWALEFSLADAKWGGLPDGHEVGKGTPLFPRIESVIPPV